MMVCSRLAFATARERGFAAAEMRIACGVWCPTQSINLPWTDCGLQVRDAFAAETGNTLIVADYGQLELRVLAHVYAAFPSVLALLLPLSVPADAWPSNCCSPARVFDQ